MSEMNKTIYPEKLSNEKLLSGPFAELYQCVSISVKSYAREAVEHLLLGSIFYILLCILLYVCIAKWEIVRFQKNLKHPLRILFVIAHPDDECMFFGPTILNFTKQDDCLVYLMCLSTGVNYGMGKTRKNELYRSCKVLGIDESNVFIHNHTLLPDSKETKWPAELVAKLILNQVESFNIDVLITFDKHGISRHINHCSIYYAVAYLCLENQLPADCKVYVLDTVNLIRKYSSFFDLPISILLSQHRFILNSDDRLVVMDAMKKHKSQFLWFRRLYLKFSRYTLINTLQEMDITDIELDLALED